MSYLQHHQAYELSTTPSGLLAIYNTIRPMSYLQHHQAYELSTTPSGLLAIYNTIRPLSYLQHHQAYELATLASKANSGDWWWKEQMAKCYSRQRNFRQAIFMLQQSIQDQPFIDNYLYLSKVAWWWWC